MLFQRFFMAAWAWALALSRGGRGLLELKPSAREVNKPGLMFRSPWQIVMIFSAILQA